MNKRQIFREQALRHYIRARKRSVLPRFLAPPVFLFFWILLLLAGVSGLSLWMVRIPVYAEGISFLVEASQNDEQSTPFAVIILESRWQGHIQEKQEVQFRFTGATYSLQGTVRAIVPDMLTTQDILKRYPQENPWVLRTLLDSIIRDDTFLVEAHLNQLPIPERFVEDFVGAKIEIGARSILETL